MSSPSDANDRNKARGHWPPPKGDGLFPVALIDLLGEVTAFAQKIDHTLFPIDPR
jgi:hypothetical protein